MNGIEGDEHIELVLVAMEGKALHWHQSWEEQVHFPSSNQFQEALLRRLQPGVVKDPFGPLLRVKQVGSVMDYIKQFERVSGPMRNVDKEIMKGIFVNGLKIELQAEVKSLELDSLAEMKDRALMLEARNREWRGGGVNLVEKGLGHHKGPNSLKIGPMLNRTLGTWERIGTMPVEGSSGEKNGNVGRRLTQEELQERSRRGLCFKGGDGWGHDQVSKMRHFRLTLVEGSNEDSQEEKVGEMTEEGLKLEMKSLQTSLHSLKGLTSSKSFKVLGRIGGKEVVMLVDTRATNNFISSILAQELKLQVTSTLSYTVEVGNG